MLDLYTKNQNDHLPLPHLHNLPDKTVLEKIWDLKKELY